MSLEPIDYVAPVLRGLTFDGNAGAFVRAKPDPGNASSGRAGTDARAGAQGDARDASLPALEVVSGADAGTAELLDRVRDGYRRYLEDHLYHPPVVRVAGEVLFAVGSSIEQADKVAEVYREHGSVGRSLARPSDSPGAAERGVTTSAASGRRSVVYGRISVVTGGAQGFGESIARALVDAGSTVFVADLNVEGAAALCEELNTRAGKTVALPSAVDVSDEESVETLVREVLRSAGGIDLFVSNAGVLKAGSVKELALSDFRFVTDVNYIGFFLCTKHASKVMAVQNEPSGRYFTDIIQINSKSGLEGSNKNGAYAGGKFGGIGLTQSFALELVEDNIKVNSVCPGNFFDGPLWSDPDRGLFVQYLRTGKVPGAKTVADVKSSYEQKVPMKRGCTGEDVMKAIYYIVDQKYETGQAVPVTGGQVMLK